jgi:UDP-N-acetylmuramate dehydrogenase
MKHLAAYRAVLHEQEPLGKYTAARLGGAADWLYVTKPDTPLTELVQVVQAAWADDLPVRIIGGGANILVADAGVRGLVVVNHITQIEHGDWHDGRTVSATAGTGLLTFARWCATHGYGGMEWAIGVPGTVGGAIVNNAGAHGDDMAKTVADVVVIEAGRTPQLYSHADLHYEYRSSIFKTRPDKRFLVLLATFMLPHSDPAAIRAKLEKFKLHRKTTQPGGASLGSIFKNPPHDYAGRLIEACGLKGFTIGNAQVSPVHANFFINTGAATATDYYTLIQQVRHVVQQQTGVELELEIELVGDWTP